MSPPARDEHTVPVTGAARPTRPVTALVRVMAPPDARASFRLVGGSCVVGSGEGADLLIADRTVSRRHAELTLVPEGVLVRDLGSRNGTFYLEQRIESITLGLGASIRIGRAAVALEVDPELWAEPLEWSDEAYRGVIGVSARMRRLFAMLSRLEGSMATVLVEGESGSGKEIVARAIHDGSAVADKALVVINCGALPRELVGSELFGHRRGAFTGATEARRGAFETADGGTLFLDEVGELPLDVQPMLLRALETGEVRRVGSDEPARVKVRIIAATNRDLKADVEAGRFRDDLYYRLSVVRLRLPALRERPEDIEPLALLFAGEVGLAELPKPVREELKSRAWPGNARELRNAVHYFAVFGTLPASEGPGSATLDLALARLVDVERPYAEQKDAIVDRFTRVYLTALIAHTKNNQSAAARLAALDRGYLGKLIAKYGVRRDPDES
jgi:two-component system, NtrC family, response regulator GlrR